jgi:hypothetical protein
MDLESILLRVSPFTPIIYEPAWEKLLSQLNTRMKNSNRFIIRLPAKNDPVREFVAGPDGRA